MICHFRYINDIVLKFFYYFMGYIIIPKKHPGVIYLSAGTNYINFSLDKHKYQMCLLAVSDLVTVQVTENKQLSDSK